MDRGPFSISYHPSFSSRNRPLPTLIQLTVDKYSSRKVRYNADTDILTNSAGLTVQCRSSRTLARDHAPSALAGSLGNGAFRVDKGSILVYAYLSSRSHSALLTRKEQTAVGPDRDCENSV